MDGSDKDREGLRDLMRGRSLASRSSLTTRQQPMGSSPTVLNDNGDCSGGDGVDANALMVRWKKEKVRASRWRSSNKELPEAGCSRSGGEDGGHCQPMHCTTSATSLTGRKKARLHGKVAEDSDAVDPAPVPRKLRSAINKRSSLSPSLATPNAKKKHHYTCNGQLIYGDNGKRCKENSLLGSFTKDEEEVVEALCALASVLPTEEQILDKEDMKVSEAHQDGNATTVTCSGVLKEDKNLMQQPMTCEIMCLASFMEKTVEEPMKDEHAPSKQSATLHGRQTVNSDLNRNEPGGHVTLSENEQRENTPFRNPMKISSAPGVLPGHCNKNSVMQMQLTKCDATIPALPACKPDVQKQNGCVGSSALRLEVQQAVHNFASNAKLVHTEGAVPPHVQSLSNSAVWPGPARLPSSPADLTTKKVPRDFTSTWKKCSIHVFIGHLIKSYQDMEKHGTLPLANEESKSRDRAKLCAPASSERVGLQSGLEGVPSAPTNNGYVMERNKHKVRNEITRNGRFMPAHQSSVLLEAKQKQAYDFFSLSASGDASGSVTGVKSSGQLPSPFLHAQVPHHPRMPFSFPHVPYVPPYTEKLVPVPVPVPAQQVQVQVPHFIGNRLYGPQMDNSLSSIQLQQQYHQQQIWQAHYAHHYRSPMSIGVSQGERIHDPSASQCQITQTMPTTAPSPSIQLQGGSYHPPILRQHRQFVANPSSKAKPHQSQQLGSLH